MNAADSGWVTIALLRKTRGNRGEITAVALSSKPERYESLKEVWLFGAGERFEVAETWFHDGTLVFRFHGVDSIDAAESLSGCEVIERGSGSSLGRVTGFDESGGSGNLVVDGVMLIPFARAICVEIDPAARRIAVELPEGLKELNRP